MERRPSAYRFTPLDESKRQIRLLHLHPPVAKASGSFVESDSTALGGDDADKIHCTFKLASLDDNPSYEALSYVWGDKNDLVPIFLYGNSFLITRNLHEALFHMRQTTVRTLWVDALCINQADLHERANQVSQMGSIFAQASVVVVYLGSWEGSAIAFEFLRILGSELRSRVEPWTDAIVSRAGLDLQNTDIRNCIMEFFLRPWWNRIWTVQEFVLARQATFQSGYHILEAAFFERFRENEIYGGNYRIFNRWRAADPLFGSVWFTDHLDGVMRLHFVKDPCKQDFFDFLDLLTSFRGRQCSDPRDKIFGLLGLTSGLVRSRICLDYGVPPSETYVNLVKAAISSMQALDVLTYGGSWNLGRPSFVPDLTASVSPAVIVSHAQRAAAILKQFHATLSSLPAFIITTYRATTQALYVDAVEEVIVQDPLGRLCDIIQSVGNMRSRYPFPFRAYWQTLCSGMLIDSSLPTIQENWPYRLARDDDYYRYVDWRDWHYNKEAHAQRNAHRNAQHFERWIGVSMTGRNFVTTSTGFMGLAPKAAVEGDHVVLMPGGKIPYVLRPIGRPTVTDFDDGADTDDCYEFIGDCYMHGIMFGEAWDESKLQPITLV